MKNWGTRKLNKITHGDQIRTEASQHRGLPPSDSLRLLYRSSFSFYWKHHYSTWDSHCSWVFKIHFPCRGFIAAWNSCVRLFYLHGLAHLHWRNSTICAMGCLFGNPVIWENLKPYAIKHQKINFFSLKIPFPEHSHSTVSSSISLCK